MFNTIPIKILVTLITELEKWTLKFILEAQKTENSQGNPEQKEQCWWYHNIQLQTILQSHSNKNNIILAQKQIWKSTETE
jgi:hypothetical protein